MNHGFLRGNIPIPAIYSLAPILGREDILAKLRQQLCDPVTRILTLTGPSGMGKSRLAVALFDEVIAKFDGGCYVDVAGLAADDLPAALAAAAGVGDGPAATAFDRLVERVGQRRVLIVVDSAEQLLEPTRSVVVSVAAACPNVAVLVVTIEKLGVYGEYVVRLNPLEVPDPASADLAALDAVPSVKLLVHRARAVRSGFRLIPENREAVAEVCRRLDGVPLALELAADRLQLVSPQDLLNELDELTGGPSAARGAGLPWHDDLYASFEKGWQRLAEDERDLLGRLAVYAGDFGHADVVVVADPDGPPVAQLLARLVDKSLLLSTEHPSGDITFRITRISRHYLLAMDGDRTSARHRHAEHILAMVEAWTAEGAGVTPPSARVANLGAYRRDVDAAIDFLVAGGAGVAAGRLVLAMVPYWTATGELAMALDRLRQVLAMRSLPDGLRTRVIAALGRCAMAAGDLPAAAEYLSTAAARYTTADDAADRLDNRHAVAQLAHHRGDDERAEALLIEVAQDYLRLGDVIAHATAVADLAVVYQVAGWFEPARRLAADALETLSHAGDGMRAARTQLVLAAALNAAGEHESAERNTRNAFRLARLCGDRYATATGLITYAWILSARHSRATEAWRRVALLVGAARTDLAAMSTEPPRYLTQVLADILEVARARLGTDTFEATYQQGEARHWADAAVEEALVPLNVSRLAARSDAGGVLTLREQEVAELVAAGLTNREISRRLGITEWTVVNHMRKVMRKLRCTSRVQVARWVTDHRQGVDDGERNTS